MSGRTVGLATSGRTRTAPTNLHSWKLVALVLLVMLICAVTGGRLVMGPTKPLGLHWLTYSTGRRSLPA